MSFLFIINKWKFQFIIHISNKNKNSKYPSYIMHQKHFSIKKKPLHFNYLHKNMPLQHLFFCLSYTHTIHFILIFWVFKITDTQFFWNYSIIVVGSYCSCEFTGLYVLNYILYIQHIFISVSRDDNEFKYMEFLTWKYTFQSLFFCKMVL